MKGLKDQLDKLRTAKQASVNYDKLFEAYANDVKERRAYEETLDEVNERRSASTHYEYLQRKAEKERREVEAAENADLPVISVFEALQLVKAHTDINIDAGLRTLRAHLNRMWKEDREATMTVEQFQQFHAHYTRNYPKSKVGSVIDSFKANGYMSLDVEKLQRIASNIYTQADYDELIRENCLDGQQPNQVKARKYILALLNKEAVTEEELLADYVARAEAARAAGFSIEINSMLPSIAITDANDPNGGWFFQEHEADQLLSEVPDWINAEDYILAQTMNW